MRGPQVVGPRRELAVRSGTVFIYVEKQDLDEPPRTVTRIVIEQRDDNGLATALVRLDTREAVWLAEFLLSKARVAVSGGSDR